MKKRLFNVLYAIFMVPAFCAIMTTSAHGLTAAFEVLETVEHDSSFFTQGLVIHEKELFESSGLYKKSKIARYNIETGELIQSTPLPRSIFAEGLHYYNDSLYLLTWREHRAFRLDPTDFSIQQTFTLKTEGWGLTHNGQHFVQSDGSDVLRFRNSSTFETEKSLSVRDGSQPQRNLNELEYAHGLIWANVFTTPFILAISPTNGQVAFSLDLSSLTKKHKDDDANHVLNGIAYDAKRDAFWITGKCWTKRYLIKVNMPEGL